MEIEGVRRTTYWVTFFIVVIFFGIFMLAERLTVLYRVILIVLLALLSANFRLAKPYSVLSIIIVIAAGLFNGAILANNFAQFWLFAFLFVILFFLSCEVIERKLLGV
jgi:hypothetical protein